MNDVQFNRNYSAFISPTYSQQPVTGRTEESGKTEQKQVPFCEMLQENIRKSNSELTFSKHAIQRLDDRQIEVSPQLMQKMDRAVNKAKSKGVTEALLLNGNTAFIVNVPNRTVVTTINGGEMKENVFTNIDGAVIL